MCKLLALALLALAVAVSTFTAQPAHACDGGPCQCTGAGCNASS